jgi:hypothetical protein
MDERLKRLSAEFKYTPEQLEFWRGERIDCSSLPPGVAECVFDAAAECGPARSVKWLHEVLLLEPSGSAGVGTYAAVKAVIKDPYPFCELLFGLRWRLYDDLVRDKPGMASKLPQWRSHMRDLNRYIKRVIEGKWQLAAFVS